MEYDDPNRDRGMLASVDRKYILGTKTYEHRQSAFKRRKDIRNRLRNTLLDFQLLLEADYDDIDQVFQNPTSEEVDGMIATLGFLYDQTRYGIQQPHGWLTFKTLLMDGISQAVAASDETIPGPEYVDVRLEDGQITVEFSEGAVDLEAIGEKIAAGETEDLDRNQLEWFIDYYARAGEFDPDVPAQLQQREFEAALEQRQERENEREERVEREGREAFRERTADYHRQREEDDKN
jgi:copper chaperone CopZ